MGGRIGLESRPGAGSTFWFEVALGRGSAEADIRSATLDGLRVLVIDDQETNRVILREMLLSWDCRTEVAASGPEALALLLANPDDDPFGLILLDQEMPGMDGEQTARIIKAAPRYAKVPLVQLTSAGLPVDLEVADGPWAARMTKPVRRSQLYNALCRAVSEGGASQVRHPVAENAWMTLPSPPRILMAEDNEVNRRVAIGMARRLGCAVEAVTNGREAIEALDYARHDLVLMDVQMPEMDGFIATAAIRERERGTGCHIPIIAMTAHAMQGDRQRCLSAGMDDYIAKPIRPGSLREALRAWGAKDEPPSHAEGRSREPEFRTFSAELLAELSGKDPNVTREILDLLLRDVPERLGWLEAAIVVKDGRRVSWEAHSLTGVFGTVGAEVLVTACRELKTLGEQADFAAINCASTAIRAHWEGLKAEASRFLGIPSTPARRSGPMLKRQE